MKDNARQEAFVGKWAAMANPKCGLSLTCLAASPQRVNLCINKELSDLRERPTMIRKSQSSRHDPHCSHHCARRSPQGAEQRAWATVGMPHANACLPPHRLTSM